MSEKNEKLVTTIKESPYGDTGAVYEGVLGMFQHYVLQLQHFRKQPKTDDELAHIDADIRGYQAVIESKNELNAQKFMEVKHESRRNGAGFADNEKIVEHMKANGLWL